MIIEQLIKVKEADIGETVEVKFALPTGYDEEDVKKYVLGELSNSGVDFSFEVKSKERNPDKVEDIVTVSVERK